MQNKLKNQAAAENEVHSAEEFRDSGRCVITPVLTLSKDVALGVTTAMANTVQEAHKNPELTKPNAEGVVKAQLFEEGAVFMLEEPFDGFEADRYIMDFYDVREQGICSRMHFHTGMRYVRIMTGPDTSIRISSLSEPVIPAGYIADIDLEIVEDKIKLGDAGYVPCYHVWVPECAWVDMQVPRGTSHQFNATGPNAVIDTVHTEESPEILREEMEGVNMMAQTIFLEDSHPDVSECVMNKA